MDKWWKKQPLLLKVILCILLFVILGLIVTILIVGIINSKEPTPEEEYSTQLEIRNAAYDIYSKEGLEKMEEFYDKFEKKAQSFDEKKEFLYNKIINYRSVCGWGCSDQILKSIHELYNLAPESAEQYELCYYDALYVDSDPIEPCKSQLEGYGNE